MNRRQRRLKAKEIIKVHRVKNAQLNKHSAFLAALNNLPDEELELLKTNTHENTFIQMYYNTLKESVEEVMRLRIAADTLLGKTKVQDQENKSNNSDVES